MRAIFLASSRKEKATPARASAAFISSMAWPSLASSSPTSFLAWHTRAWCSSAMAPNAACLLFTIDSQSLSQRFLSDSRPICLAASA
uniref:Putative secreted protein n=1 Tax=Ixodes ricinus TaxID=34613 RepID=A0A6B0U1M1_IXORI